MSRKTKKTVSTLAIRNPRPTVATFGTRYSRPTVAVTIKETIWGPQYQDASLERALQGVCR